MKLTNVGHIEISVKRAKTEPFVFWCLYYLFKHSSSHKKVKEGGGGIGTMTVLELDKIRAFFTVAKS